MKQESPREGTWIELGLRVPSLSTTADWACFWKRSHSVFSFLTAPPGLVGPSLEFSSKAMQLPIAKGEVDWGYPSLTAVTTSSAGASNVSQS